MIDSAQVTYKLIDSTIPADTPDITAATSSTYGLVDNILNLGTKKKGVYLEKHWFILDGTHTELTVGDDVGWESAGLSDSVTGAISGESLTLEFASTHFSYGLSFVFPPHCPFIDFTIEYKGGGSTISTTTVTGNTLTNYTDQADVFDWDTIIITPTKVQPGQRARLWSLMLGIDFLWTGDELIKVSATKITDLTAEVVESAEVLFQFYNDSSFDFKTIKDVPDSLQREILITLDFGIGGTFVQFGKYKSASMNVLDRGKIIEITGYDIINRLGQSTYKNGAIPSSPRTLKSWADEIAADAGITIVTDASLTSISSSGYIPTVPHREAFRLIAEAANCILFTDSDGILNIAPYSAVTGGAYTEDEIEDEGIDISSAEKIDGVIVHRYTFVASATASGLAEIQGIALTGTEQEIWVDYGTFPAEVDISDVATSANIILDTVKSAVYSEGAKLVFTGTVGQVGWITVIGYPYGTGTTPLSSGTDGNVREIKNPLITDEAIASSVLSNIATKIVGKYRYSARVYNATGQDEFLKTATIDSDEVVITKITKTIEADIASEIIEGVA